MSPLWRLVYNSTVLAKKLPSTASHSAHTGQDCLNRKLISVCSSDRIVPKLHQMPAGPIHYIHCIQKAAQDAQ